MELPGEVVVRRTPDRRRAETFALGLDAAGLDSRIDHDHGHGHGAGEFRVVVAAAAAVAAERALEGFDEEVNALVVRELPVPPAPPSALGWTVAALILAIYLATGPVAFDGPWFQEGGALSAAILHGEPFRAVTALCLHASFAHALGNAAFAVLLAGAVGRALGGGLGGLLVLLSGALGNLATAVWYRHGHHASIGASTAVFGALGLLATPGTWRRGSRFPTWVLLGASLAFFGMVGTDRDADIVAHLFGLGMGLALGVAVLPLERVRRPWMQPVAAALTLALLGASWGRALHRF